MRALEVCSLCFVPKSMACKRTSLCIHLKFMLACKGGGAYFSVTFYSFLSCIVEIWGGGGGVCLLYAGTNLYQGSCSQGNN